MQYAVFAHSGNAIEAQVAGIETWWSEYAADEWADPLVIAMKLGGVDNLFFVSGSELVFFQEAIAKAESRGLGTAPGDDDARARRAECGAGQCNGA